MSAAGAASASDLNRTLLRVAIVCLCVTAAIAIGALLGGDYGETEAKISLSTLAVGLYTLAGMVGIVALERSPLRVLGQLELLTAGVGLALALGVVWADWDGDSEDLAKAWGVVSVLALGGAQACGLLARAREGESQTIRTIRGGTVAAGFVAVALAVGAILGESDDDGLFRVMGAAGILNVLGLIVLPILRRLEGSPAPAPAAAASPVAAPGSRRQPATAGGQIRVVDTDRESFAAETESLVAGGADLLAGPGTTSEGGRFALLREPHGALVVILSAPPA